MTTAAARLERTTLRTSRLLDFCSRKELIAQTGHQPDAWPLVEVRRRSFVGRRLALERACKHLPSNPRLGSSCSPPCSEEHGVSKVIPDEDCLADAYRRAQERAFVQQKINAAQNEAGDLGEVEIPDNLRTEVEDRLSEDTAATWDSIVRDIAEQKFEDDDVGDDE